MTLEEHFANLSVIEILNTYEFPHRFLAYYNSQISKEAIEQVKYSDPRSLKAVEIAQRFGNGEDFSKEELEKVYEDARSACNGGIYTRFVALIACNTVQCVLAHSDSYLDSLIPVLFYNNYDKNESFKKSILFELIKTRMTKLEKLLIFGVA